jgi:hypothetical protein
MLEKQVTTLVPKDLHEAMRKVAAVELRSMQQQCLHVFYRMVEEYGYDIPISYEDGQKLRRKEKLLKSKGIIQD